MKKLLAALAPHFGPKVTATLGGFTALATHVQAKLEMLPADITAIDVVVASLGNGDWMNAVPSILAGAGIGYTARKSKGDGVLPVEPEGELIEASGPSKPNSVIQVPLGVDLDEDSDVVDYFADNGVAFYYTWRELLDGDHLPEPLAPPVTRGELDGLRRHVETRISDSDEVIDALETQVAKIDHDFGNVIRRLEDRMALRIKDLAKLIDGGPSEASNSTVRGILNTHGRRIADVERKVKAVPTAVGVVEERLRLMNANIMPMKERLGGFEDRLVDLEDAIPTLDLGDPEESPSVARNYRNLNPGNIEITTPGRPTWSGEIDGDDPRFATFESHVHGTRALMKLLQNYQRRHGLRTIRGIVGRWSPVDDATNPTGSTENYISHVSELTGFAPDKELDLVNQQYDLERLTVAMAHHEGGRPYPDIDQHINKAWRIL